MLFGLLGKILSLPVTGPLAGAQFIVRKLAETADGQFYDPLRIRNELAMLEEELNRGLITEAAYELAEADLLDRLRVAQERRR